MTDFLMKPKIDYAFKEIMTDEKARKGFLSAVLKLNPEDIIETRLLNTNLRKTHAEDTDTDTFFEFAVILSGFDLLYKHFGQVK